MFKSCELEKLLYCHPNFLGLWNQDSFAVARHLLQAQLVGHVLKDVGLVLVIVTIKDIKPGNFDPTDGGIFARVRFVCYAFSPSLLSILKGKVETVFPGHLTVNCLGLPLAISTVPSRLLPRGTVYNPEKRYFVWTKVVKDGSPKYFEIEQGDVIRLKTAEIVYGSDREITTLESPNTEPASMTVIGDIRTHWLGPVHWFGPAGAARKGNEKPPEVSLLDSARKLDPQEPDYLAFMQKVRNESSL